MTDKKISQNNTTKSCLPSDWNGEIKNRQGLCPHALTEHVRDDGGGDSRVTGLPHSDQRTQEKEPIEVLFSLMEQ